MARVRRSIAVSLVLTLLALSAVTAVYGLDELERELDDAISSLEDVEAALAAAEREIAAAERRLREAESALAAVEAELVEAEAELAEAEDRRRRRADELQAAEEALTAAERAQAEATQRLQDRSVEVFKYGAGREQQALVTGLLGASDWHEVAVSTSTVSRVVASDRELVDETVRTRDEALAALEVADRARDEAVVAEVEVRERGASLLAVVEEHEAALATVEEEHQKRQAVVADLEADSELMAMLVSRLEDELAKAVRAAEAEAAREAERQAEREREAAEAARRAEEEAAAAEVDDDGGDAAEESSGATESEPPDPDPPAAGPPAADPQPTPAAPAWAAKLPASGQPWAGAIAEAANANGVDPRLLAALVWTESTFNPHAVSWVGAIGLAQLMPRTAASLGVDPWDPIQNLDGGARYLAQQHRRFGSLELALAAYNAGPTAVQNAGPAIPNYLETQLYVVRVLERYNLLAG